MFNLPETANRNRNADKENKGLENKGLELLKELDINLYEKEKAQKEKAQKEKAQKEKALKDYEKDKKALILALKVDVLPLELEKKLKNKSI
jgi:hypothetical protein